MRSRMTSYTVGVLLLAAAAPASAVQQPIELPRIAGPITIDGVPDEAAWMQIAPVPVTMYTPEFRGTPTQRTVIRVGYDDDFFYAAGWFYDTDPSGIRINSLYRDRWNGDDAFAIYIDAFNDNQNAKWFGTTPGGIRFDQLVTDDGNTLNGSWDTFWQAESTVTEEGWFSEVRIPFSSIGFQPDADGRVVMGLTLTRVVSRLNERVTFPAIDPAQEFRRPSVAQDVVLRDVRTRKPLYVTPYALTGVAQEPRLDENRFRTESETSNEVGLDVRYPLSSTLTLDLTVNTDFAQVEADDQQVNLDRFPLFFPELRRFFQEGSGNFDFTTGGSSRLFHSRRIGLTDIGPVPVLGGARLVGRVGQWDVGLLDMQTEDVEGAPGANFGVLRMRRPVLNANSTAGVMLTSLIDGDDYNLGLGADGVLRVKGNNYLLMKWAGTLDSDDTDDISLVDRSHGFLRWERRTQRGLGMNAELIRSGSAYRPELGFLPRRDYTSANVAGNYYIFTEDHSYFRRVYPGALAFSTYRNSDGVLESGQYAVWVQWDTRAGGGGWVEPKLFIEDVVEEFDIGDKITIPEGNYEFADLQIQFGMPAGRRMRTAIDFRAGTYFDGTRAQVILTPTWNVSRHLELGADYQLSYLDFQERNQSDDIHVARLRVRTALDARTSGNAFVQYNSTTDRMDFNVRLRYAFAEGTDLWLVYNEGLATETSLDPVGLRTPRSLARTLILKYSHTFGW